MIEALVGAAAKAAETVAKVGEVSKSTGKEMFDPRNPLEPIKMESKELKPGNTENFDPKKPLNVKSEKENTDVFSSFPEITREDRIEMAQRNDGEWSGEPGDSKFTPNDIYAKTDLTKYDIDGIEYCEGNPDFKPCSVATVEINDMTSNRPQNFRQADAECAKKWNEEGRDGRKDWKAREVADWRSENQYSWHECSDMKTMDLVPRSIHGECKHYGGVAECKRHEFAKSLGGSFDA